MTLTKTIDHVSEALEYLLEQFKGKPKFEALITSYINQIQDLEDAYFQLLGDRLPADAAEGVQLDGLGGIVGEPRNGRSDTDYRVGIESRILLNLSSGQPEALICLLNCSNCNGGVELTEYFPAAMVARSRSELPSEDEAQRLANLLQEGKAAGVKAHFQYGLSPEDELFQYDSGPGYDQGKWSGAI